MQHKLFLKKIIMISSILAVVILCGMFYFIGKNSIQKTSGIASEALTLDEKERHEKEIELKEILLNYDKNIVEVITLLESNDNELTKAYILIVGQEKVVNEDELLLFISENINLDIENIDLVYMDIETFTSSK